MTFRPVSYPDHSCRPGSARQMLLLGRLVSDVGPADVSRQDVGREGSTRDVCQRNRGWRGRTSMLQLKEDREEEEVNGRRGRWNPQFKTLQKKIKKNNITLKCRWLGNRRILRIRDGKALKSFFGFRMRASVMRGVAPVITQYVNASHSGTD